MITIRGRFLWIMTLRLSASLIFRVSPLAHILRCRSLLRRLWPATTENKGWREAKATKRRTYLSAEFIALYVRCRIKIWTKILIPVSACMIISLLFTSCEKENESDKSVVKKSESSTQPTNSGWIAMRETMVKQLRAYKITDKTVLEAMGKVRRHMYIPEEFRQDETAYGDHPWPIGHDQTISQPYIVAYMTEKMSLKKGEKLLEVGTGSGYQAAIIAEMGVNVYSIEILPELAEHARIVLKSEGYDRVKILTGDGYKGWPEHAPFDVILVACAPKKLPEALVDQLKENGRMIIPVGEKFAQRLVILRKKEGQVIQEDDLPVRFVPMVHGE